MIIWIAFPYWRMSLRKNETVEMMKMKYRIDDSTNARTEELGRKKKQETEGQQKKGKRTHIIQVILDDYEKGDGIDDAKKRWRSYPDKNVEWKHTIKADDWLYDEIGKRELIRQVLELQEEGLLEDGKGRETSGWYVRGSELEKIVYSVQNIDTFYDRDGRTPKYILHYEPIHQLQKEIKSLKASQKQWKPWLLSCIEALEQDLEKEKIPPICTEKKEKYFKTLTGLNELEEPMYKRIFSKRFLGGSKVFENAIQSRIIADARKWNEFVDEDKEVMTEDEVLSEIGIETYHQELSVKGPLKFELNGQNIDTSYWKYGAVLNAETLKNAVITPEQNITKVITIENRANFMAEPFEEQTLYIFSHGFFSPKERTFLKKLREVLEKDNAAFYHSSDLDYGGIRIFTYIKEHIFPEVKPLHMDAETFTRYQDRAEQREEAYLAKIRKMDVPEELQELKNCILESGSTIEQESMLY